MVDLVESLVLSLGLDREKLNDTDLKLHRLSEMEEAEKSNKWIYSGELILMSVDGWLNPELKAKECKNLPVMSVQGTACMHTSLQLLSTP